MTALINMPLDRLRKFAGLGWERIGSTGPVAGLTLIVTALAICGLAGLVR